MGNNSSPSALCQERPKTYHDIKREVCAKYKITIGDLDGPRKERKLVLARREAWWRGREECKRSYTWLAYYSGRKDHTTILHGVRMYNKFLESQSFVEDEERKHVASVESGR